MRRQCNAVSAGPVEPSLRFSVSRAVELLGLVWVVWLARNRRQSWAAKVTWENKAEQGKTGSWPLAFLGLLVHQTSRVRQSWQARPSRQDKTRDKQ